MKLNKLQRYALVAWLGSKIAGIHKDHTVIYDVDNFCRGDGEMSEWRIISTFGMAGKIWNVYDKIYVTGYSIGEVSQKAYHKQQKLIKQWNKELKELIAIYA